ncbi:flagellar hook-basal body complex protein FliE [Sulfitobacter pacificus]|uniref:Flagellar hook-basal body complex protein FliE n=1 Tax=Sulfitobacter pacificus TaxID=1499314 RepID=A0ABQ5VM72_9RHOB|nr:flagellar hook-basal body complex protein FliE [Sulfitobacter pacificus]GLQ28133.1 flagellar hook-basal body protein FliE [Sulfitobacter pacificus]
MSDFAAIRSSYVQAAYSKAADTKPATNDVNPATADFSTMVSKAAAQAVDTVRTGDQMAIAGLNGQAGLQQVVEATMAMESTVQVSVALRDKLVEAYQDIMRMPI